MARTTLTALGAATMAAALTFGLAGTAAASSVPPGQLEVCSNGNYQTNAYFGGVSFGTPAHTCNFWSTGITNASMIYQVDLFVNNGGYIASAQIDLAQGGGLATGGTPSAPTMWSF
jgi:hypothetical protein